MPVLGEYARLSGEKKKKKKKGGAPQEYSRDYISVATKSPPKKITTQLFFGERFCWRWGRAPRLSAAHGEQLTVFSFICVAVYFAAAWLAVGVAKQ